jgi:hypothetical protein
LLFFFFIEEEAGLGVAALAAFFAAGLGDLDREADGRGMIGLLLDLAGKKPKFFKNFEFATTLADASPPL